MAAGHVSQASAQSLQVSVAGNPGVSQLVTAYNDGHGQVKNDASTIPEVADLLPDNNAAAAGVAPQDAGALIRNGDGFSYACAGLTGGAAGGAVQVGDNGCTISPRTLTRNLANLDLDLKDVLGKGAISGPLKKALNPVTDQLGGQLDTVVKQITDGIRNTPLGKIGLFGSLSVIQATCTANTSGAHGDAQTLDTTGRNQFPIAITLPNPSGGSKSYDLLTASTNYPLTPTGTEIIPSAGLNETTQQAFQNVVQQEVKKALAGQLGQLSDPLKLVLDPLQEGLDNAYEGLSPALDQISSNLLSIRVNKGVKTDGGKKIDVTAFYIQVLPAAKKFAGASLVSGQIGHVTCGPNGVVQAAAKAPAKVTPPRHVKKAPHLPTAVNSGLAHGYPTGSGDQGPSRLVLGATSALLLVSAGAATAAYRRFRLTQE
ncbi:MAG: hypothetical protein ACRDPH_09180 [Marmoricola sp.]